MSDKAKGWALAGGVLIGAFAAAVLGHMFAVAPVEERNADLEIENIVLQNKLAAFETANDIAKLHVRAYEISQEASKFCAPAGIINNPERDTRNFIENMSSFYRRDEMPVAKVLQWLDELKADKVRFVASDELPRGVAAQFFNSAGSGKTLVFSTSVLFSDEYVKMFEFHRELKAAGYGAAGTVKALVHDDRFHEREEFGIVSGPAGGGETILEKGQYRLPVTIAAKPC